MNDRQWTNLLSLSAIVLLASIVWAGASMALTDPTRPFAWSKQAGREVPPGLVLSEIVTRDYQMFAVINGTVVKTGDLVQGYLVTKIYPNAVYLLNANGSVILPLTQSVRQAAWT